MAETMDTSTTEKFIIWDISESMDAISISSFEYNRFSTAKSMDTVKATVRKYNR